MSCPNIARLIHSIPWVSGSSSGDGTTLTVCQKLPKLLLQTEAPLWIGLARLGEDVMKPSLDCQESSKARHGNDLTNSRMHTSTSTTIALHSAGALEARTGITAKKLTLMISLRWAAREGAPEWPW